MLKPITIHITRHPRTTFTYNTIECIRGDNKVVCNEHTYRPGDILSDEVVDLLIASLSKRFTIIVTNEKGS